MTKLHQIVAVREGKKTALDSAITAAYKLLQKSALFDGLVRHYQHLVESDDQKLETIPPDVSMPKFNAMGILEDLQNSWTALWDITATQEWGNTSAKADIKIGDKVLLADVPVTMMMFMEKQLIDVRTVVTKMPVRDTGEKWETDADSGFHVSPPFVTNRTKKVHKTHVLHKPTEQHPAQCEPYTEDSKVGEYTARKFSGAISLAEQKEILGRIAQLLDAIKTARTEANCVDVEDKKVSDKLFDFILKGNI